MHSLRVRIKTDRSHKVTGLTRVPNANNLIQPIVVRVSAGWWFQLPTIDMQYLAVATMGPDDATRYHHVKLMPHSPETPREISIPFIPQQKVRLEHTSNGTPGNKGGSV